jgi:hypothetical protein
MGRGVPLRSVIDGNIGYAGVGDDAVLYNQNVITLATLTVQRQKKIPVFIFIGIIDRITFYELQTVDRTRMIGLITDREDLVTVYDMAFCPLDKVSGDMFSEIDLR